MHQRGAPFRAHSHVGDRVSVAVEVPAVSKYARRVRGVNERPRSRLTVAPTKRDTNTA